MSAPLSVAPKTEVSNSCNNWSCCAKKKDVKHSHSTAQKTQEVAEKYRRGSHQTDYTVEYDVVHMRVHSHIPEDGKTAYDH